MGAPVAGDWPLLQSCEEIADGLEFEAERACGVVH